MRTMIFEDKTGRRAAASRKGVSAGLAAGACGRRAMLGAALCVLAAATVSCVKSKIYNTPHPLKGALVVTTDWSDREQGVERPAQYTVRAGETSVETAEETVLLPGLLSPGRTNLYIYNVPQGMTVDGLTAAVSLSADGLTIEPLPGRLFSASHVVPAVADDTVRLIAPVHQQTRRLQFRLSVSEGDPQYIDKVTGVLTGVAHTFDIAASALGSEAASTAPAFVRSGDKVETTVHLLGVVPGAGQTLKLTLTYTDGQTQTVESDLSAQLEGFNDRKTEPLLLTGNLHAPVAAGAEATITDWESGIAGGGGDVVAD